MSSKQQTKGQKFLVNLSVRIVYTFLAVWLVMLTVGALTPLALSFWAVAAVLFTGQVVRCAFVKYSGA